MTLKTRTVHRHFAAAAVVGALSVAAVAAGPAGAAPGASHKVTGGKTTITLKHSVRHLLKTNNASLTAIAPATLKGATLTTPVKSGTYTGISAKVNTTGGFRISMGSKGVSVTNVRSDSNTSTGVGKVSGHGRIAVVKTSLPTSMSGSDPVTYSGFTVTLAKPLVKILDTKFNTKLFKQHAEIGTGTVTMKY